MPTRFAGFWIRLLAHGLDELLILVGACLSGLLLLGIFYWLGSSAVSGVDLQFFLFGSYLVLGFCYYTGMHYLRGATIGKRLLGLRVVNRADHGPLTLSQAALRSLAYLGSLPFGMGFLLIGLDPEKRGLHDLIAGSAVTRTALSPTASTSAGGINFSSVPPGK